MQLKNRIAIVSGASKGLGKAIAVALVKKGVTVYGLARIEKHLMKV
ncbi:MAG: SDR family NAD(P)-dependent oxidoreductase [Bacteroidia bacterium]|nr:SDR family NAD(P)-dependent oxidoreductase [Bacteroidia bacterium]